MTNSKLTTLKGFIALFSFYALPSFSDEIPATFTLSGECTVTATQQNSTVSSSSECKSIVDSYLSSKNSDWSSVAGTGSNASNSALFL